MATVDISTAPAFRRWLFDQLVVRSDGVVQVSRGFPRERRSEAVWLAGTASANIAVPTIGSGRVKRDESFVTTVNIAVATRSGIGEAEDRAFEILGWLEDAVADDPKAVELDGILGVELRSWDLEVIEGQPDTVTIEARVETEARLS